MDLGEDALHLLQVGLTSPIEAHAARAAVEERDVEVLLQQADVFHGFLPTLSFRCSCTVLGRLLSLATPTPSPLDGRVF